MSPISGFKGGTYTKTELDDLRIVDIPGNGSIGPVSFTISASAGGLPPSNPGYTLTLFPSSAIASGTDSLGQIGVLKVFTNFSGDGRTFDWAAGGGAPGAGSVVFDDGFWKGNIRVALVGVGFETADVSIFYNTADPLDPADFPNLYPNPPHDLDVTVVDEWPGDHDPDPDTDKQENQLTFTYDDPEIPDGFVVTRSSDTDPTEEVVSSVPYDPLITVYTVPDIVYVEDIYTYCVRTYRMSDTSVSACSPDVTIPVGGPPANIFIVGSGGLALGGSATITFIGDPSGIYTIVEGKTHDTLYQRTGVDHIDMPIPNPYGVTGYLKQG